MFVSLTSCPPCNSSFYRYPWRAQYCPTTVQYKNWHLIRRQFNHIYLDLHKNLSGLQYSKNKKCRSCLVLAFSSSDFFPSIQLIYILKHCMKNGVKPAIKRTYYFALVSPKFIDFSFSFGNENNGFKVASCRLGRFVGRDRNEARRTTKSLLHASRTHGLSSSYEVRLALHNNQHHERCYRKS